MVELAFEPAYTRVLGGRNLDHSGKKFTHCPLATSAVEFPVNLKSALWKMFLSQLSLSWLTVTGGLTEMVGPGQL